MLLSVSLALVTLSTHRLLQNFYFLGEFFNPSRPDAAFEEVQLMKVVQALCDATCSAIFNFI